MHWYKEAPIQQARASAQAAGMLNPPMLLGMVKQATGKWKSEYNGGQNWDVPRWWESVPMIFYDVDIRSQCASKVSCFTI
jgi:hypothetical protein